MKVILGKSQRRLLWTVAAGLAALGVFVWAFRDVDFDKLFDLILQSNPLWILLLLGSIPAEQIVRGWKWRQLLYDIKPIGSLQLFGAIVGGYFANMLIPLGISPLVRSWLIARLEGIKFLTIVMTTAIERFVDGVVFAGVVMIVAIGASLPDTEVDLESGLILASFAGFLVFLGSLGILFSGKRFLSKPNSWIRAGANGIERRFPQHLAGLGDALAEGVIWPKSRWRAFAVVLASIAMKAISVTHFLWAGLAIGTFLGLFDYLFLMVFAGFSLILARFIRVPGGFVIGSAYGLKLLGIADEEALAMVLLVHLSSLAMIAGIGALALWILGIKIQDVRRPPQSTSVIAP